MFLNCRLALIGAYFGYYAMCQFQWKYIYNVPCSFFGCPSPRAFGIVEPFVNADFLLAFVNGGRYFWAIRHLCKFVKWGDQMQLDCC